MPKSKTKTKDAVTPAAGRSSTMLTNGAAHATNGDIARRAYDLYLTRGCEHRHDVDDWLEAERELRDAVNPSVMVVKGRNARISA
jgi:Protein of unknown function (DUF2934)